MTLDQYNEMRYKDIADKYNIPVSRAKEEYEPDPEVPDFWKNIKVE